MIQIIAHNALVAGEFADDVLTYDSRLEDFDLQRLRITHGLNKGGTAEIVMPPGHPYANSYVGYKTIVEIYRAGELRFRGRALYPLDDFDNARTVVCEGERCFLNDAVLRGRHLYRDEVTGALTDERYPDGRYLYQVSPAEIFRDVIAEYNAQVDPFKQFQLGEVDVTDPNNYVRLESEEAETVAAVVDKLVERCGGYIAFSETEDGKRAINWKAAIGTASNQTIEAGENLFGYNASGANTDLATVLIPYGAKDETTGERVTIASVNGGLDYITDDGAVEVRGKITKTVTWDDVTDPQNLLTKARQYLNECKLYVTTLTVSALDLSYIEKDIESFKVGDRIRVISAAHGLKEDFQLYESTEDLLNPAGSFITLGKEVRTLTGLDVAGDSKSQSGISKVSTAIKKTVDAAMVGAKEELTTLIEQKAGEITLEASGSLGSQAQIRLTTAGGTVITSFLDLQRVREAFANDTSAVTISGGLITFNSNTLVVNSTNLKVSEDGTIYATNAVLSGTATTENGNYKSELSGGRLRFFYEGTEYGGIASGYMVGDASTRGVAVRLEKDAKYIGFSKANEAGDSYDMVYCISFGATVRDRTERHLFFGTAYFDERVVMNGGVGVYGATTVYNSMTVKGHLVMGGNYSLKFTTSTAEQINCIGISSNDKLSVGNDGYELYVYGTAVCLGHASEGLVQIRGAESSVTSPFTFANTAKFNTTATFYGISFYNNFTYFSSNAYFLANTIVSNSTGMKGNNAAGTDTIWMLAVNNLNEVVLGDSEYTTYIQGASILIGTGSSTVTVRSNLDVSGAVQLNNGFGVQVKNTGGTDCYILSLNASNQVNVGHLDYPMYLRGTSVTVNTGNLTVYRGSVVTSNGYGVKGVDTSGNSYFILSVNTTNQVSVGTSSLPLYLRGSGVYLSSTGATVTSDRRKKNSIETLPDAYEALLDKLTPVRFKYNDGTSGRYHAGFIAQDVKAALEAAGLSTSDFGGFVDVNGDGEDFGLIYSEFIALLLHKIKRLEQRLNALPAAR